MPTGQGHLSDAEKRIAIALDDGWADGEKYSTAGPTDRRGSDRNIALVALSVAGGLGIGLGYLQNLQVLLPVICATAVLIKRLMRIHTRRT
jgi:hypothetical protein